MPFNPLWIPLLGELAGTVAAMVIVALVLDRRVEEKRLQLEFEVRRLNQEWEAAQAQRKT